MPAPWHGKSPKQPGGTPSLEEAIEDAYNQAKAEHNDWLTIDEIRLRGENPIREYHVIAKPTI